ncbi:MAG: hypothetical protein KF760_28440 [Candidatus Eremiobacteraeota bacterium]|nr:hypothetical protein [Candidatus Eremiobacteraeota bacterium]MCW5865826.1 hypothetical protein [Candidatus Eremiobacteraeota bacterium]
MRRQILQSSKNKKVKLLKDQAVLARLRQVAKEEAFDFASQPAHHFLKLYIRLSSRDCAELQIPYKNFETVLPQLRGAVQSLRALYAHGLRFRISQAAGHDWTLHQELP